ncbi:hypothetical protein [Vibrio sp. McD22-P3]|uniref:hypothetical protein n=1 Tax=Vibrio sp. McD22-P3 TaxID=2724880 RepID=UPI001F410135|nr:hypothetical protein [Vibrio sp. McD22-P3]MCF4175162.1 hypothetical protein [Vibrio sp. McD22-P3]
MNQSIFVSIIGMSIGLGLSVPASEANDFDIKVDESGQVIVSCEYAAMTSSEYLDKIISGQYLLESKEGQECSPELGNSLKVKSEGVIIGVPSVPNPIAPRCKCPETYEAEVQLRWMAVNQMVVKRNQQQLSEQFDTLEASLDQKNLKYLLDKPEFSSLNQLRD